MLMKFLFVGVFWVIVLFVVRVILMISVSSGSI